ncbi:MAG TPA: gamma-glutamyltransferase [Planctomycetota bacterium]|nr:gamma-glutamyltransferase [Planctomycetota bacterium]
MIALALLSLLDEQANARPARGERSMVVAEQPVAARAGLEVLRKGGNAADAAIATAFALAVVYPQAGNIGGGGFLLWRGADGKATSFDFREKAPLAAKPDMYLDEKGEVRKDASVYGPLAAGIPGSVAGLSFARERLGTKPLAELLAPAIELAEKGFPVDPHLADDLAGHRKDLERFPASAGTFLPGGKVPRAGEILRQPDLARTLRAIAEKGRDGFYRGEVAKKVVEGVRASGGIWTEEDLAQYRAVEREPIRGTYNGHEVLTMGPPSGGGIFLLQSLAILEGLGLDGTGPGSSLSIHLMAETFKRAFADRAALLGDEDFVPVPIDVLLSEERTSQMRAQVDALRATDPEPPPRPGPFTTRRLSKTEGEHTTHLSVVDASGNCVSLTTTINDFFGCHFVAPGTGFLLNNEMDDFVVKPDSDKTPNRIEPQKRMLSSMTPTVVSKEGKPEWVLGTPGGTRIPATLTQVLVNLIDHGMDLSRAVRAPRIHQTWAQAPRQGGYESDTLEAEPFALAADVRSNLERRGHQVVEKKSTFCSVQAIAILPDGTRLGFSDPRRGGTAVGE